MSACITRKCLLGEMRTLPSNSPSPPLSPALTSERCDHAAEFRSPSQHFLTTLFHSVASSISGREGDRLSQKEARTCDSIEMPCTLKRSLPLGTLWVNIV